MKPVVFLGSSRADLLRFPERVRRRAGHELFLVQAGRRPADFKPMPAVGAGVYELRVRDEMGAFRVIYVAKFSEAVFVLHAFSKRSQKTSALDLELARTRYRSIGGNP